MQAAGDTSRPNAERPSRRRGKGSRRAARQATWHRTAWELVKDTTNTCVEYRVTGLAAEAAFFTLLSIPPLLLGLAGTLGYLDSFVEASTIDGLKHDIISASGKVLSNTSVEEIVVPLLNQVFGTTRPDIISLGFLLSLWSGSRALYIFIDTITVMYGLDGKRGIVKTRLMSLGLYLGALVIGSLVLPLLMAGPGLVENAVPGIAGLVDTLYGPVAIVLLIVSLTTLYHLAVPVSTPWREDIPGALVALVVLVFCSVGLRIYLVRSVEGSSPSAYGSLAAPVAVLLWIFVVALAVLIGAAMNAAIDRRWPTLETADARAENERAQEEAAAAVIRDVAARRAGERARRARELGLAEGVEEEWGEDEGEDVDVDVPSEYPERWADVLAADNVRGRLTARGGPHHRPAPPPPDSDRPGGAPPGPGSGAGPGAGSGVGPGSGSGPGPGSGPGSGPGPAAQAGPTPLGPPPGPPGQQVPG
ncbi:YihY/virulence factor BrkB family protein [Kitasatospora sp. NPDC056783]|uniref:YihY/virulence factor BrkB family protein n=1 Tax=Kitasatospora sp. NPDC056783 TaxID=3345943 RepID=UPI003673B99E